MNEEELEMLPAMIAWGILVGSALLVDVWLKKKGYALLTHVAQTPNGRRGRTLVDLHFDKALGKVDPFSLILSRFGI